MLYPFFHKLIVDSFKISEIGIFLQGKKADTRQVYRKQMLNIPHFAAIAGKIYSKVYKILIFHFWQVVGREPLMYGTVFELSSLLLRTRMIFVFLVYPLVPCFVALFGEVDYSSL